MENKEYVPTESYVVKAGKDTRGQFMLNVVDAMLGDLHERGIIKAEIKDGVFNVEFDNIGFAMNFNDIQDKWIVEIAGFPGDDKITIKNGITELYTRFSYGKDIKKFLERVGYDYGKNEENTVGDQPTDC